MPEVTKAMLLAAQCYLNSCGEWLEAYKKAYNQWEKEYNSWSYLSASVPPDIYDYVDDSDVQKLWAEAEAELARARRALNRVGNTSNGSDDKTGGIKI